MRFFNHASSLAITLQPIIRLDKGGSQPGFGITRVGIERVVPRLTEDH